MSRVVEAAPAGARLDDLGPELAARVRRVLSGSRTDAAGFAVELDKLHHSRVLRARSTVPVAGRPRSIVLKRVKPRAARRTRLLARRWLPWLGLENAAPALLGTVNVRTTRSIWHVYEDIAGDPLRAHETDRDFVAAAVDLIADIHTRAASHPLVSECRREGEDFGSHFFTSNVRDALSLLDALRPPAVRLSAEQAATRDRLRTRLERVLNGSPDRAASLAHEGGPDTLLHGDLWAANVLIARDRDGVRVRLIDWDHTGAGPIAYDLSCFLGRFAASDRCWILDRYRSALARGGWRLPAVPTLNLQFETVECARCANRIIWPALALLHDGAAWGFAELAEVEQWLAAMQPVIPA